MQPVAGQFDRVAAGHHIDQQPAVRQAIERGGHAGRHGGGHQAGPHRDQKPHPLRRRHQRRGDDPRVLAGTARREQGPAKAELVDRLGDLPQITGVGRPSAAAGAQIPAVAVRGMNQKISICLPPPPIAAGYCGQLLRSLTATVNSAPGSRRPLPPVRFAE